MRGLKSVSIWGALLLAVALANAKSPEPSSSAACPGPANHSISTDAPGHIDKDCVRISKSGGHTIVWKARHGKLESIIFETSNEPQNQPPFVSCAAMPCTITCDGTGKCESGAINPALRPPDDPDPTQRGYRYRYRPQWVSKGGAADPMVMIDP